MELNNLLNYHMKLRLAEENPLNLFEFSKSYLLL